MEDFDKIDEINRRILHIKCDEFHEDIFYVPEYMIWNIITITIIIKLKNNVRNKMSQYLFNTCNDDGKPDIFYMSPNFSIFFKMIKNNHLL